MIVIDSQEVKLPAYVNKPDSIKGKSVGVIVLHDWWGLGNRTKKLADQYSSLGYVAIAPDLYLGSLPKTPEEARKLSSGVSLQSSKKLIDSTVVYLKALDVGKIGINGFSLGGTLAFNYLCESKEIAAAAIYYAGNIPAEDRLRNISTPLLIIYGDQDQSVEPEDARQLEQTLKILGKDAKLLLYKGPHLFFNEEDKQNYRADAAKDAWEKTVEFLNGRLIQDWQS